MDVSNIPAVASAMSAQKTADQVDIAVLKTALDSQASAVAGLLAALPTPAAPVTSSIGQVIDTHA
jgi:hypothetical protein